MKKVSKSNKKIRVVNKIKGNQTKKVVAPINKSYKSSNNDDSTTHTRVKKREFVMDVNPSTTRFKHVKNKDGLITSIADIIGNLIPGSFPWLSKVAKPFENFVFHTLNYEYKPSCPTTTQGSLTLVPEYDSTAPLPVEKTDILSKTGVVKTPLWNSATCALDPKKLNAQMKCHKVRDSPVTKSELRSTDPYHLGVMIDNGAENTSSTLGEIWVNYDVDLSIPKHTDDVIETEWTVNHSDVNTPFYFEPVLLFGSNKYVTFTNDTQDTHTYCDILFSIPNKAFRVETMLYGANNYSSITVGVGNGKQGLVTGTLYPIALYVTAGNGIVVLEDFVLTGDFGEQESCDYQLDMTTALWNTVTYCRICITPIASDAVNWEETYNKRSKMLDKIVEKVVDRVKLKDDMVTPDNKLSDNKSKSVISKCPKKLVVGNSQCYIPRTLGECDALLDDVKG